MRINTPLSWKHNRVLPVLLIAPVLIAGVLWQVLRSAEKPMAASQLNLSVQELYDSCVLMGDESNYEGDLVSLTGQLSYISKPYQVPHFVTFKAGQVDKCDVHCSLGEAPPADWEAGTFVTVTGRIKGVVKGCIYIEQCAVVD